jgi:hypothetical protein
MLKARNVLQLALPFDPPDRVEPARSAPAEHLVPAPQALLDETLARIAAASPLPSTPPRAPTLNSAAGLADERAPRC